MKEEYGGQRGRCPNCQGAITVPAIETEAGMDLLPLEGAMPAAPAPPSNAPVPSFSLGLRLPPAGPAPASVPSLGGDSNIGLAPLEEPRAKPATSNGLAAPPATAKSPGGDSMIGLAPLEESFAKQATQKPTVATTPANSPAGDSDLGLQPIEGSAAPASKTAGAPTSRPAAPSDGATKPATPSNKVDDTQRIVCPKCGTKMRCPLMPLASRLSAPNARTSSSRSRGRRSCGRDQKNADQYGHDPLADTPASSQDLGGGMLDMLGDGAAASVDAEAGSPAGLASPKLSGGKSKGGNMLLVCHQWPSMAAPPASPHSW